MKSILGWDIGGAHLKLVRMESDGRLIDVQQVACPLWQGLSTLSAAMDRLMTPQDLDPATRHALTMTAELVDAFESRSEGVRQIIHFMETKLASQEIRIFAGDLGFQFPRDITPEMRAHVASANWLASGLWVGHKLDHALLVDIGSTTTDILAVIEGAPKYLGYCDEERIESGELVYTGVARTPLMAISGRIPLAGRWKGVLAESFATASDVYRMSLELKEGDDHYPAADHGPKTLEGSARRIARQYGLDQPMVGIEPMTQAAGYLREQQLQRILEALHQVISAHPIAGSAPLVAAGVGRFLVPELARRLGRPSLDFSTLLSLDSALQGYSPADCAPAAAVAALASLQ